MAATGSVTMNACALPPQPPKSTSFGGISTMRPLLPQSLMQHRLALLAARITVVPGEARSNAANLRQLQAALSLVDLRQASLALSRRTRAVIDAFLAHLASACRTTPSSGFRTNWS